MDTPVLLQPGLAAGIHIDILEVAGQFDVFERIMLFVQWAEIRFVRLQEADVEQERIPAAPPKEIASTPLKERRLALLDRQLRGETPREPGALPIMFMAEAPEVSTVVARAGAVAALAHGLAVDLAAYPLLEAVLGIELVAEVPLAHVGSGVVVVAEQFGHAAHLRRECDAFPDVRPYLRLVWPEAGQHGRPRWRAERPGHVGLFEDDALIGKLVDVGRMNPFVAVDGQRVGTLLIGLDDEQVALVATTPPPGDARKQRPPKTGRYGCAGRGNSSVS